MNIIDPQHLHRHAAIRQREVAAAIAAERQRRAARPEGDRYFLARTIGRQLRRLLHGRAAVRRQAPAPVVVMASDGSA